MPNQTIRDAYGNHHEKQFHPIAKQVYDHQLAIPVTRESMEDVNYVTERQ